MSTGTVKTATVSRELLRKFPILGLLSDEQLGRVVAASRLLRVGRKTPVVLKGQTLDHLSFLLAGKIQVVDYLADGREIGLNIIQAGGFFGELAVIDRMPRSATLITLTPAVLMQVPGEVARRIFFEHPPAAEAIMVHFSRVIRRMTDLRTLQALPHSFQRVYALLYYLKESDPSGVPVINDMPTHQEIAIMVNTSRETVTRAISMLAAEGIVEKAARRLRILRPEALKRLAEESRPERSGTALA